MVRKYPDASPKDIEQMDDFSRNLYEGSTNACKNLRRAADNCYGKCSKDKVKRLEQLCDTYQDIANAQATANIEANRLQRDPEIRQALQKGQPSEDEMFEEMMKKLARGGELD
jgi:hypothetical protein